MVWYRFFSAALALVGFATFAAAQTFTWVSNTNGDWSTATNWAGSSGPSTGGGSSVELIFNYSAPVISVPATVHTAANDLAGTFDLNKLTLDTRFGAYTIGSTYLGLSVGGTNLIRFVNDASTAPIVTMQGAGVRVALPSILHANTTITGNGSGHLVWSGTISGSGQLIHERTSGYTGITHTLGNQLGFYGGQTIITGNNTFTGGVELRGGNISYSIPSAGHTPFGTGTITVNGTATSPATLRMDAFSSNPLTNDIVLNSTLYYTGNNSGVFSGTVSGSGDWVVSGLSNTFRNPLTMTGRLIADGGPFRSGSGTIILADNATALNVSGIIIGPSPGGGLTLNNNDGANILNRLPDNLIVKSSRAILTFTGNGTANSSETIGGLSGSGFETISLTSGSGVSSTLTFSDSTPITRQNSMMLMARGVNLGQLAPSSANAQNVILTNPGSFVSSLIGNPASLDSITANDVPILPWGIGVLAATGNPTPASGTLLTYHSVNGIRPLPTTQFASSIPVGSTTQENVRITGSSTTNITSNTTINSLVIANTSGTGGTSGIGTLTISGNVVLAAISGAGSVAQLGNVTFPGEAYLTTFGSNGLEINGTLTAPSLVKAGTGVLTINSPLNVSGPLTVQVGLVNIDSEAKLGSVSEVRLNGGVLRTVLPSGTVTLTKPIFVSNNNGQLLTGNPGASISTDLIVNTVIADMPWTGSGPFLPGHSAGSVQFGGLGNIFLNAANTYSSNTILSGSATVVISQQSNLGTGSQIIIEGGATLRTTASFTMTKSLILNGGAGNMTIAPDAGTTLTWNGPIHQRSAATQSFALTKAGDGTLVIGSIDNTFYGLLNINQGTVHLTGSLAPMNRVGPTGAEDLNFGVLVNNGGTLSGNGTTQRVVFVDGSGSGGTIAPGEANAGSLTTHGVAVDAGGNWLIGIANGSTPAAINTGNSTLGPTLNPTSNSQLVAIAGIISIDNGADIIIDGTGVSFTLGDSYSYRVALADGPASITSVNITDPARFSTIGFDAINFSLVSSGNVIYLNFTPVPEPLLILPVAAVAGAVVLRRKRGIA
jgi:fibronectin-binding autotransporter adhesin